MSSAILRVRMSHRNGLATGVSGSFQLNEAHVRRVLWFGYLPPHIVEAIAEARRFGCMTVKRVAVAPARTASRGKPPLNRAIPSIGPASALRGGLGTLALPTRRFTDWVSFSPRPSNLAEAERVRTARLRQRQSPRFWRPP